MKSDIYENDNFTKRMEALNQEIDEAFAEMKAIDEQQKKYQQIIQVLTIIFWIVVIIAMIKNWIL